MISECNAQHPHVTLHQNTWNKSNPKFPNCDCITSVPSWLPDCQTPCCLLWATWIKMRNGNWATFCQCLVPWFAKNQATLTTTTCSYCITYFSGVNQVRLSPGENLWWPRYRVFYRPCVISVSKPTVSQHWSIIVIIGFIFSWSAFLTYSLFTKLQVWTVVKNTGCIANYCEGC